MKYEVYQLTPEMCYEILMSQKSNTGRVINGIPAVLFKGACTRMLRVFK